MLEIVFRLPDGVGAEAYVEEARLRATQIVNRFIQGYRLFSADAYAATIRPEEIPLIEIRRGIFESSGSKAVATFENEVTPVPSWDKVGVLLKRQMTADQVNELKQWLRIGMPIGEHQQIILAGVEYHYIHEDYQAAVIFAQTGFEVFLSTFIRERAKKEGITDLPLQDTRKNPPPVVEALAKSTIKHILKTLVPFVTNGRIIAGTTAYNEWNEKAYELRNEVVHGGKSNVTSDEARIAGDCVTKLIIELNKLA